MSRARVILVVEDNPTARKMLRVALQAERYRVVEATDGQSAIAAATAAMPDLVLLDIVLPDMSGFDVVRRLRPLPGGDRVPILALSGFFGHVHEQKVADAGFTAMLVKPVEPTRLIKTIGAYFPVPDLPEPALGAGRRLLLVEDDATQLRLFQSALQQLGFEVATATGVDQALALAGEHPPDVIVSDVLMPGSDGFQLCLEVRRDPRLARTPVVLMSASYQTPGDRQLARRVGANALVAKGADFAVVGRAAVDAIAAGAPAELEAQSTELKLAHARAVTQQLERQLAVSTEQARRCTLQAAQISLLSGVGAALTHNIDTDGALRDVLSATLEASGLTRSALFLRQDGKSRLELRLSLGFSTGQERELPDLFGHGHLLVRAIEQEGVLSIPSRELPMAAAAPLLARAGATSLQLLPLVAEGEVAGLLLLVAARADAVSVESLAFARAMGNQLIQSLQLARAFSRLTASELRYRTLVENASDAITVLTPEGVIREVNGRWAEILGYPTERLVGMHIRDLSADGHVEANLANYGRLVADGGGRTAPTAMRKADGGVAMLEFSNKTLTIGGEPLIFSIGRDITEQLRANAQLMVSDRMASVGTLAAGVAHEINNPLAAVTANLELANEDLARLRAGSPDFKLDELSAELEDARFAAERVRDIVRDLKIFSRAEDDRRVVVDIADTGPGIPPEILSRLFTLFFTTKPVGVGTGLGLAICQRIVTGLGGEINVKSEPGRGTTFSVVLPIGSARPVGQPHPPAPSPAPRGPRGRILVIDDDDLVRSMVRRLLGREHEVVASASAVESLARIGAGERFDLVLCDLMMPVMTGMELHAQLLRVAPAYAERMVFMTGGAFTASARAFIDGGGHLCIEKPFTPRALRAFINERLRTLDAASRAAPPE